MTLLHSADLKERYQCQAFDTTADTKHILHEVDAVLRSSKTVVRMYNNRRHAGNSLLFVKDLQIFATSGKNVTFIREPNANYVVLWSACHSQTNLVQGRQ